MARLNTDDKLLPADIETTDTRATKCKIRQVICQPGNCGVYRPVNSKNICGLSGDYIGTEWV